MHLTTRLNTITISGSAIRMNILFHKALLVLTKENLLNTQGHRVQISLEIRKKSNSEFNRLVKSEECLI